LGWRMDNREGDNSRLYNLRNGVKRILRVEKGGLGFEVEG